MAELVCLSQQPLQRSATVACSCCSV